MNIWESYNFKIKTGKSAKELLEEQQSNLAVKTKGLLRMEVTLIGKGPTYEMSVVADLLNRFRRNVLTITEENEQNRFPVTIKSNLDNITLKGVKERDFLNRVSEVLLEPTTERVIRELYHQLKEHTEEITKKAKYL